MRLETWPPEPHTLFKLTSERLRVSQQMFRVVSRGPTRAPPPSAGISLHRHSFTSSIPTKAVSSRDSLNNGANMRPVGGDVAFRWRSGGGSRPERSSGNQQQSCRNHPRPSFAFHTGDSSGDGSHPLLSAPTRSTSDMPLIFHSAIMEKRTFVTPRRISRAFRM